MGYTHYWYRPLTLKTAEMAVILGDFNKIVLALDDAGVKLADGFGEGVPKLTTDGVWFNGLENCGHAKNEEITIPWPAKGANGINSQRDPVAGSWFAGALLATRTCNGDCSYETFSFDRSIADRKFLQPGSEHPGLYFDCCKTAYRPYDLAVTAFLLIAKHHLGNRIHVSSDGEDEQWDEAKRLCYVHLGYGPEYYMDGDGLHKRRIAAAV